MTSRLTRTEEQAEIALYLAKHPMRLCNCQFGYTYCYHKCSRSTEPFADIIDQLIETGRVLR